MEPIVFYVLYAIGVFSWWMNQQVMVDRIKIHFLTMPQEDRIHELIEEQQNIRLLDLNEQEHRNQSFQVIHPPFPDACEEAEQTETEEETILHFDLASSLCLTCPSASMTKEWEASSIAIFVVCCLYVVLRRRTRTQPKHPIMVLSHPRYLSSYQAFVLTTIDPNALDRWVVE